MLAGILMKRIFTVLMLLQLNACGIILKPLAMVYNNADPCQHGETLDSGGFDYKEVNGRLVGIYRQAKTTYPSFCGSGRGTTYVSSYYRSGRVVSGHFRSTPDGSLYNNLGYR